MRRLRKTSSRINLEELLFEVEIVYEENGKEIQRVFTKQIDRHIADLPKYLATLSLTPSLHYFIEECKREVLNECA